MTLVKTVATFITVSLLWCPWNAEGSAIAPLTPHGSREHHISPRMVGSPQRCSEDGDCGDTTILTCDHEKRHCICKESYHVLSSSGKCLPAKQLGEACTEDAQCQVFDKHAVCADEYCACDSGTYLQHDNNGTLCNPDKLGGSLATAQPAMNINMIIVISAISVMFIGICVALHLFSKARFRNRRTIFNSPHPRLMHIKLGKRKKSSIRTQHLPPPGQPVPRHHSFSGHHSPFPVSKVPKTRSQECLRTAMSATSSPKFEPRCRTAPLAERESLPSTEDLDKKTPEPIQNGPASILSEEESPSKPPGSPTVIITDADGSHTVVTNSATPSSPNAAVNV